jgi:hypothetical protein
VTLLFGKLSGPNDKDAAIASGYSLSVAENTKQRIRKPPVRMELTDCIACFAALPVELRPKTVLSLLLIPAIRVQLHDQGSRYGVAPNRAPAAAVTAMASAPQNVTRVAPLITLAPPADAAHAPSMARKNREAPATTGIK